MRGGHTNDVTAQPLGNELLPMKKASVIEIRN